MIREYPDRPFIGVGAVVVLQDGRVVLVRRRQPPRAGEWSLPGGAVELGETLTEAVAREVLEETGLRVRVGPVVDVLDRITRDPAGAVQYHYVLVDYLCWGDGEASAGSDAAEVAVVEPGHVGRYALTGAATAVIERALQMAAAAAVAAGGSEGRSQGR
jgi:ADP-ribose pyrophosphatase YjhB (NUDIX family)